MTEHVLGIYFYISLEVLAHYSFHQNTFIHPVQLIEPSPSFVPPSHSPTRFFLLKNYGIYSYCVVYD